ncbi:MAG: hypothetical protein ACI9HU_001914 [Colwellia sp.]|jgi:hypothetical protein
MKSRLMTLVLLFNICLAGYAQADDDPSFSWDTVPIYGHFGATAGMSDKDVEFIAKHYDFITIEKAHGAKLHNGISEPETFTDTARIKAINPNTKVLFYWNLLLDYPFYESSQHRKAPDDWFIHSLDGKLHLKRGIKQYDLSNKDLQRWWVKTAKSALAAGNMDGVFIDAVPQIGLKSDAQIKKWGSEKFHGVEAGISETLALLQAEIGTDKTVIYNGIRSVPGGWKHGGTKYLNHASGIITEHFNMFQSQKPEQIAEDLSHMIQAGKAGKSLFLRLGLVLLG